MVWGPLTERNNSKGGRFGTGFVVWFLRIGCFGFWLLGFGFHSLAQPLTQVPNGFRFRVSGAFRVEISHSGVQAFFSSEPEMHNR